MKSWILLALLFSTSVFAAAPTPPMSGLWNSECFLSGKYHHLVSIEIRDDLWTFTDWAYSDQVCDQRALVLEHQTMHQVDIEGANWNGKALMSYLRPYARNLAAEYNQIELCGHSDWKYGRIIEVTGLSCKGFDVPRAEQRHYSIFNAEGPKSNLLYLGTGDSAHDGRTEEGRYQVLSDLLWLRDPAS